MVWKKYDDAVNKKAIQMIEDNVGRLQDGLVELERKMKSLL